MPYRTLDPAQIIRTAERLERRVSERFPNAGLAGVATELSTLSVELAIRARELEAPIWWLRAVIGCVIAAGAGLFLFVGTILPFERISSNALASVEGIEATINTILLAGLGFLALVRAEERIKRKNVFRALHSLRSLVHVIDMHQLTKDPAALAGLLEPTASSPERTMSPGELARYLDYCSEMLSITGKIAALFAQSVNDAVVIETVNDIEELATNLSRKIWQKIMMIEIPAAGAGPA